MALAMTAGSANAVLFDFTDRALWQPTIGSDSATTRTRVISDIGVTLTASGGRLVFEAFDGRLGTDPNPCESTFRTPTLACSGDGFGISNDEISAGPVFGQERLTVSFFDPETGQPMTVGLEGFEFLDLFAANTHTNDDATEVASWQLSTGEVGTAEGIVGTSVGRADRTGWLSVDDITAEVAGVTFFVDAGAPRNTDFALAAITVSDPPREPAPPSPPPPRLFAPPLPPAQYQPPPSPPQEPKPPVPVPEPWTLALIGAGLAGLLLTAGRRSPAPYA